MHRELVQLDRERILMNILFGLIVLVVLVMGIAAFAMGIPTLILLLWLPLLIAGSILVWRIRKFKDRFKPRVMNLILQYIDPELRYYNKDFIPADTFQRSGFFGFRPAVYEGEDYIRGQVGEVTYELCELDLKHPSPIRNRVERIFRGIFFHANMPWTFKGKMVLIPKENWQFNTRTIKYATAMGGNPVALSPELDRYFKAYAQDNLPVQELLSSSLVQTILNIRETKGKKVYMSFVDGHLYIAIEEPKDLLEPELFRSNTNFEVVSNFYEELLMLNNLVRELDLTH